LSKTVDITYRLGNDLPLEDVLAVYRESGLGERRPIEDHARFAAMLRNANLVVTAWAGSEMVGVARSITDWVYVTYLADLAVKISYQRQGIGKELIRRTREACGPATMLLLLAAPAAEKYYPHIGFEHHHQAWLLRNAEKTEGQTKR
jgi:predicted N-acetyltransferase YhbS